MRHFQITPGLQIKPGGWPCHFTLQSRHRQLSKKKTFTHFLRNFWCEMPTKWTDAGWTNKQICSSQPGSFGPPSHHLQISKNNLSCGTNLAVQSGWI